MQILLKTKLAGSTWAGPSQILAGFGEPAKFVSCGTGLSKNVMFDCLSSRSTSFSKSHSNNFSLALKKFLVASLLWLSSHHPKLAVIISCHTNKTIYVLSCTKVALELLRLLVPPQWRTASSDGSQPSAAGRDCGTMCHHTVFLTLAAVLWVMLLLASLKPIWNGKPLVLERVYFKVIGSELVLWLDQRLLSFCILQTFIFGSVSKKYGASKMILKTFEISIGFAFVRYQNWIRIFVRLENLG